MGFWVVAFSARASGESAWLLLGLTGMGAMFGMQAMWVVFGEVLGVAVAWLFMAKPFKRLTDQYDSLTIPDFLSSHFKSNGKLLRVVSALTLTIFVTIFVSAQLDATGKAFEDFLNWQYYHGLLLGFCIVLVYITFGGFIAVAWSDFFQGLIMFFGLVALPVIVYFLISKDIDITAKLRNIDPALVSFQGDGNWSKNVWTYLGFSMIGLGFLGSPQIFVRFMSIKSEDEINKGRWVAIVYTIITDAAAVFIGILGRAYFSDNGLDPEAIMGVKAENVLPMLVDEFMPIILIGFYIAAVLSAIMSTIDSLLIVASSAIARDFYQKIYRPDLSEEKMGSISRLSTIGMALLALAIALTVSFIVPERNVFWFSIFGWSGIAATFCPMIILSLFWSGYRSWGAIASMITGFISVGLVKFWWAKIDGEIGFAFAEMGELLPSFLISMTFGVILSKMQELQIKGG
ncbi:MAG: sodium/proline symporter [Flavobacteriales bacterium]|nr:sodium/proline symporter [Flavobacteriales bacterium]